MRILRKINQGIDRWLHKEEIAAQEIKQAEMAEQLTAQLEELYEKIRGSIEQAKIEHDKCLAENHENPPTLSDINRYYGYHKNYVENLAVMKEKTGIWILAEKSLIGKAEFITQAQTGGWDYLRDGCGLAHGDLNNQPDPWSSKDGWNVGENC